MEELIEDKFNFTKNSYLTIGSITKSCLKYLPPLKPNLPQNMFIGDARGILYVCDYNLKENEIDIKIKTSSFQKEITCVDINYTPKQDKIYFSLGNSIFLTNRLCKEYSKIEFDIADNITMFRVIDNQIWLASGNYLNQYEYGQYTTERYSHDNEALVTALAISEYFGKMNPVAIVGTNDNKVKVINPEKVLFSLTLNSIPTALQPYKSNSNDMNENNFLFGTQLGGHGILALEKEKIKVLYEKNYTKSEVVAMKTFDINLDGSNEILLIRANGDFDIFNVGNNIMDTSQLTKYQSNDILTGFDVGKFRNNEETDIMISSYSGLVLSLTPTYKLEEYQKKAVDKKQIGKILKDLKNEVEQYQGILSNKKEEYEKLPLIQHNPVTKNPFKVNSKFTLLPNEAAFLLLFESEFPLEMMILESKVQIDILEVLTKDVILNQIENKKNSKYLATFKLKESCHQLELKIRTYEGATDTLICTVIPYNKPKTANVLEIPIKSLSLHKKIEDINNESEEKLVENIEEKALNVLTIKGKFTSSEINQILHLIIPDIPDKMSKEEAVYYLKSTFINTSIKIVVQNNFCQMKSIFFSPLIIVKEQITKEASIRKKEMEFNIQLMTLSIFNILEKIHPMIEEIYSLETKHKILQAFKEIDSKIVGNTLPQEYQNILDNKEDVNKSFEKRNINLNYLKIMIENLLRNIAKVKNFPNLNEKLQELNDVFNQYSYEKLLNLFKEIKNM